jgi:hypothetical protein
MLFTITTTATPATDLGYLLHKNPARLQLVELAFGNAHVFYPEATQSRCTAALMLEVDPVQLVRGRGPSGESAALEQYVNDKPYIASSLMSVAISRVYGSALAGNSRERHQLADTPFHSSSESAQFHHGAANSSFASSSSQFAIRCRAPA